MTQTIEMHGTKKHQCVYVRGIKEERDSMAQGQTYGSKDEVSEKEISMGITGCKDASEAF